MGESGEIKNPAPQKTKGYLHKDKRRFTRLHVQKGAGATPAITCKRRVHACRCLLSSQGLSGLLVHVFAKSMFIGEYSHTIDVKGRLAMPAKFRAKLQRGAVVTRGLDSCLFVFSAAEWKKFAEQVVSAPLTKANSRAFSRFLLAGAVEAEFDKQGRILIPEYLRAHAGLSKKTVVAGLGSRIEIWDDAAWQKYSKVTEKNSVSIAEELSELGI